MRCPACGETNGAERLYCVRCGAALSGTATTRATIGLPGSFARGRYRVRRLLGEGGRKRVYLATDTRLEREVALALIKTEGLDDAGVARVHREARALGRLGGDPHIVTVFDVGEEGGQPYIVSEFVAGGSVDDLLQRADHHRLPLEQTLRVGVQVCRALEHAHDCGVIHRDLKPSNVWLTADGTAKLGDFGLALARDRSRLTVEGMLVGTAAYMPPEQALGRPLDARSDLYALGAMLYEMVTGRPPFLGDDAVTVVSQHINTAPVAPHWHNPAVPRALEALILKLLAKVPEDRPRSAAAVREALGAIAAAAPTVAERGSEEPNPLDHLAGGVFVGRARELGELRQSAEEARAGRGRLVLLLGEPGIGKTRTASELTTYARLHGFQVLWGRCHEGGGAPAYWPWVQVIRAYLHDRDSAALRSEMGSGAPDIAQVVSEVRERLPDLPPPPALDAEQARFRLFDSITTFLKNAAGRQPLVLVLDDLHSADTPSLLLLQFLARAMEAARLLVVGTYRDLELGREHPLFQALGDLAREPVTRRIALHGLSEQDVGRYIEMTAGMPPPGPLVAVVHAETEGNPFFLGEVVHLLVAEGGLEGADARADWKPSVPQGVREVLGRRFGRLSAECNQVLAVASVVGREFALDVLEPVTGLAGDRLLERLDEAIAARVVVKVPDARGRFRFSHALVRETLYEELSTAQRVRLHRGIGEALEAIHGVRPERHLAALAYHFSQAADAAHAEQAITYARRAGARAVTLLAYEEGARLYGTALEMLAVYRPTAELERGELLLELGEAQRRAGDIERAKEAFREAAALAKRLATPELLAHAALAYAGPAFVWQHDEAVPPLLEEALASLGEPDGALRALVMARLATALYFAGSRDRCESLSARAVEMARRVGDPATLAHALHSRHVAVWGPRSLEERLAIATEIVTLAETIGDKEQVGRGRHLRIADLLELGEVAAAYREMEVQSRLADEMRQPLFHWHRAIYRTMRALLEGRFEEAERLAQETLAIGQRASPDAMETFAGQVFPQWREQGRLAEAEVSAAAFAAQQPRDPRWRVALGIIYLETGREADARREFEALAADDFAGIREDAVWLLVMSALCEICSGLRDAGRAATLYRMLSPYAARNVVAGAGVAYWGSLSFFLGLLATTMARWAEAARHFEAALEMNARMGAAPRVAYTQFAYAQMLLERGEPGDTPHALELLGRALDTAQALGMKVLLEKALALKLRTQGVATADLKTSIDAVAATVRRERPDLTADAAPDGTVTVLFTDIEGYTAMTERLGDLRAQDVLRAHGAIVRQQVAAHGGREVKSQGDGFMVVFASARRAILCAIAVQRTIAGYSAAHPEEPIRVRIGLHTGEVIREAEDFFGKNVILAARIASEASGGEILVSSVSKELTESAGDIPFGDGRAVQLKGLVGVRQVFDVRWAGTPAPERREVREGRNVFRCEGEYWTLVFEGTVCRLRDAKGLHHIACLLRHPGESFEARVLVAGPGGPAGASPVIELVGEEMPVAGLGDAGAMLDAKAKAAYRRRLEELREEREEADRFNDPGRAARAREEIEYLTEQLAAAVGLGGRDRKAASAAERARLTVTKRIKDALARIRESHLALGDHLAARIKTGYVCVYKPDAARPVSWEP